MAQYNFKADAYSSHAKILALTKSLKRGKVLDVGCAEGHLAQRLLNQGWFVDGIEYNKASAKKAEQFCTKVFVGDITNISFLKKMPSNYDVIILGDVIEHVFDPQTTVQELLKHLKKDGNIIISVPNVAHLYMRLTLLAGIFDYWEKGILDKTHIRFFTKSSLKRFFKKNSIEVLKWRYTPVPLPEVSQVFGRGRMLSFLHHVNGNLVDLWPRLLAYQFVVLASKNKNR